MKDPNGMNLVRKAFIVTGLGLPDSGKWSVNQLTSKLQALILKHDDIWTGKRKPHSIIEKRFSTDRIVIDSLTDTKVRIHTFGKKCAFFIKALFSKFDKSTLSQIVHFTTDKM
jgi:hypothetical protein